MTKFKKDLEAAARILARRTPILDTGELEAFVDGFLKRREIFLRTCRKHGSPLYLIEEEVLRRRANQFLAAFRAFLPDFRAYFAVKSNSHPAVAKTFVDEGLGLDVSSGKELQLALECGSKEIVFSGPGKTGEELTLAVKNRGRVTVLMDSFAELGRLNEAAERAGASIRAGVRLTTNERALWAKFGIPLGELPAFFAATKKCRRVALEGLQFHTSWNLDPKNHVNFIERLGGVLKGLDGKMRGQVRFIDIGGGYWPPRGEWLHPAGTPRGQLRRLLLGDPEVVVHHKCSAAPIEEFARRIGSALQKNIFPHLKCRVCAEPGRWLCHDAMHLILTVVDKKRESLVITDAGTNAVGWERFENDYFPVINLSRPSLTERPCHVLGSLCTPHDVWGYSYHGRDIRTGDILLIPDQGAYTFSLRQEFIKPLPKAVLLRVSGFSKTLPGKF